jgi:hypothetical protein
LRLLKGHLWELSIHPPIYWRNVLRDINSPPILPYYKLGQTLPYGKYEKDGQKYIAKGTYLFPFAFRYFKKID